MRTTIICSLMGLVLLLSALAAGAAPSYLGPNGLIFTPDDNVVPRSEFNVFYHAVFKDLGFGSVQSWFGANVGVLKDIEVGFTGATDVSSNGTDFLVNAKWRVVPETLKRPGVAVGAVDIFDQLDGPSLYFVVGKDIAPLLEHMTGKCIPVRLTAGYGAGLFRNGFFGANWLLTPNLEVIGEYSGTKNRATPNNGGSLGVRWAVYPGLKIDATAVDFDSFGIGLSYSAFFGGGRP